MMDMLSKNGEAVAVGFIEKAEQAFASVQGPALLFITLELIDGFLTMWATNHGYLEVNRLVVSYSRLWLYPASKLFVTMVGILVLLPAVKNYPGYVRLGFILASIFLSLVVFSNLMQLGAMI